MIFENEYPPIATPTKIELVPKAMFLSFDISDIIAMAMGRTPSRRP